MCIRDRGMNRRFNSRSSLERMNQAYVQTRRTGSNVVLEVSVRSRRRRRAMTLCRRGRCSRTPRQVRRAGAKARRDGTAVALLKAILKHLRIDHRGAHIALPEQFLNRANIVPRLEQMRRDRMPQRMAACAACPSPGRHRVRHFEARRCRRVSLRVPFDSSRNGRSRSISPCGAPSASPVAGHCAACRQAERPRWQQPGLPRWDSV